VVAGSSKKSGHAAAAARKDEIRVTAPLRSTPVGAPDIGRSPLWRMIWLPVTGIP